MSLINRSPGAFVVLASVVVYGVVCAEIWTWTVASTAAVVSTFVLIGIVAAVICRSVLVLLDDATDTVAFAAVAVVPARPAAVPARAPARAARPATPRPAAARPFTHHAA